MLLYFLIIYYFAFAFVLVHLVVALSAYLNGKNRSGTGFILAGAIVGFSALLILSEWRLAIYLWLFGSSMISCGAVMNATNNENFNDSHKQICFLIYLIITFLLFISLTFFII